MVMILLHRLNRFILESRRPGAWRQAAKLYKQRYPFCQICFTQKDVEAHDVTPYRLIPRPETLTIADWLRNFITLCRHDHRKQAHCGDPSCLYYNPRIRELAAQVREFRESCVK